MTAFVVPFTRKKAAPTGWTQAELAEFYRVEATLIAAGMQVETERGLTDEDDPWFVFFHAGDEPDPIIHFARIGGSYLVSAPGLDAIRAGHDFHTLVRQLLAQYEDLAARRQAGTLNKTGPDKSGKVVPHPASILWILVALAFVKSAESRSFDGHHAVADHDPALLPRTSEGDPLFALISFALQSIVITWAVDSIASTIPMGAGDRFLSWLAAESHATPERTMPLAIDKLAPANMSYDDHGAHATDWANQRGSGGVSTPPSSPITMSEHPILDHASDQPETYAVTNIHNATEMAPIVVGQAPSVAQPIAEAEVVFAAAEVNAIQKSVENLPAVPNAIVNALGHAIHPLQNAVTDTITHPTSQPIETTHASVTNDVVAILPLTSGTIGSVVLSNHTLDTSSAGATTTSNPVAATASLVLPPMVPDRAELAVATSAVHEFLTSVPQAQVIAIQNTLIVYDPLAVNINITHVQAFTFDFSDGSHISLVGLPGELTHALTGHT